jgi:hypothetical protein
MKLFIYKTLFIFLLIYLLFQLTIGLVVKKVKEENPAYEILLVSPEGKTWTY